jgi:Zn2+/Cd2+-exporting ATPase
MKAMYFKVWGMDCAEEVGVLKSQLGPLVGGADRLSFDVLNGKMTVSPLAKLSTEQIISAVAKTGMTAEVWQEKPARQANTTFIQKHLRATIATGSLVFLIAGFISHSAITGSFAEALGREGLGATHSVPIISRLLYGGAILAALWLVLPKAWFALQRFRPDMNLLMVLAVAGAIAIGEWFEAATVSFLFAVSLALEAWSVARARNAVGALLELSAPTVRLRNADGSESEIPAEQAIVGTVFIVKPGEKIPLDGVVTTGQSEINQAPITGESMPVAKDKGSDVYAGTINGGGLLEIRATKPASDTMLARIVKIVGEAQSKRAPSEQWVERFATIYTPVVFLLALCVAIVPPLLSLGTWSEWTYRALVLLVIGCPCALVISTPVSIVASLTAAARNGVLVKGGSFMELPAHLNALAVDKTGTLTRGSPEVVEVVPFNGHDVAEVIHRSAALEANSEHPLAKAILSHAKSLGVKVTPAIDFQIQQGKGATGVIDGRKFWLGSQRLLQERGQETPEIKPVLARMSQAGQSIVIIGNDQHVCGLIAIADAVRTEARAAVDSLHEAGIKHVVMLTGDNKATAAAIGSSTGVDEVRAELLPEDKVAAIESLLSQYKQVGMVGDGVNDAPALGRATIGIAMGSMGTDAAIETADIALMSDDLSKLSWLIHHSRKTLRIIRQNVVFSLVVKAIFVILTMLGQASLWAAISADMGASLLVVMNALRLASKPTS